MKNSPKQSASERGIALVVVLLLMAVLSGLATGFAVTGQTEVQMSTNEVYFAGARAAAEAGLNRALVEIFADTTTNWISGADGAVDAANPSAVVNADNGSLAHRLGNGPYFVDASNRFSYEVQILDDDNDLLYETPLTSQQRTDMGESGSSAYVNQNDRVVLRSIGYGPSGTVVRLARIIETVDTLTTGTTSTNIITNPAIIVDGDLLISGNPRIDGTNGSVHTNGNFSMTGSTHIAQNATASGTYSKNSNSFVGGSSGGGRPAITIPTITASNYLHYATHLLKSNGTVVLVATGATVSGTGWELSGSTWQLNGNSGAAGTFYVESGRDAKISGNPGSAATPLPLSIISTGSIEISGNPYLIPHSGTPNLQFVAQKDLKVAGNVDADGTTVTGLVVEGQSLVGEQMQISGNPDIRGQIIVKNATSTSNLVELNAISGNPTVTYNGSFGGLTTTVNTPTSATTYVNNVSGWMEQ